MNPDRGLAGGERRALLAIARGVIVDRSREAWSRDDWNLFGVTIGDRLLEVPRGVFVTLRRPDGELRGCIGSIRADLPLFRETARSAVSAAFHDPRFLPVDQEEAATLTVHVSVLSEDRVVADPAGIRLGIDGVRLEHQDGSALFLPSVALEAGWDLPQLLASLARKAGLPTSAIVEGRLYAFESEAFGESD